MTRGSARSSCSGWRATATTRSPNASAAACGPSSASSRGSASGGSRRARHERRPSVDSGSLPATVVDRIDQACDRFESAWQAGRRPRIEDHLGEVEGPERSALLHELLLVELECRRASGERPHAREYRDRFSSDAEVIAVVFGAGATAAEEHVPRPQPAGAHAGSDRNLLFGILAVQMDFVTPDALIAAMSAWVLEKAKPLGRILLDRRALTEDEHQLLEALVAKHLQKHGGDPARSLAAVDSVGSVREQLVRIADPDLQASLAVVATGRPPDGSDATRTHVGTSMPVSARRFRVLRSHARGGLGEVFVALDEDLHREVALKEIQAHYADDPQSRARFLLEAEVTGGLEHPGVVPVYGLGTYADGRPYYAMRFIKGDSLKEAVARFHQGRVCRPGPGRARPRIPAASASVRRRVQRDGVRAQPGGAAPRPEARQHHAWARTARRWSSTGAWPRSSAGPLDGARSRSRPSGCPRPAHRAPRCQDWRSARRRT